MASFYKEGNKIVCEGIKGTVVGITETYRKNVIVVKPTHIPGRFTKGHQINKSTRVGLFEFPDGKLKFSHIII